MYPEELIPRGFQQRTNTSCQLALPTHGFTVVLSVFGGTPPTKPLKCKFSFLVFAAARDRSGAHHTGDQPMLIVAKFNLPPDDITWMSFYSCSSFLLSLVWHSIQCSREIKKPCLLFSKQGWLNLYRLLEPAYSWSIPIIFDVLGCGG